MNFSIFILGIFIGSFLNVCIERIPQGQSIIFPPSHCPKCGINLRSLDLIPILNYIFLKGKCKYCGYKISLQYPLIELVNGLIYLVLFIEYGFSLFTLKYMLFSSLLIIIGVVDYHYKIIPDGLIIFGFIAGLILHMTHGYKDNLLMGTIGLAMGGGIFLLIALITNGAMGGGDIKLMALIGFWLGWKYTLLIILLSFISGAIISIILLLLKLKGRKDEIPFGPFIGISTLIMLFKGQEILYWYIKILMS